MKRMKPAPVPMESRLNGLLQFRKSFGGKVVVPMSVGPERLLDESGYRKGRLPESEMVHAAPLAAQTLHRYVDAQCGRLFQVQYQRVDGRNHDVQA